MKRHLASILTILLLLFVAAVPAAHALLARVGPVRADFGYPAWYQDTTGLAFDFCSPTSAAELDGGWCVLFTGDIPTTPEVFPSNFFDEHFYWLADAGDRRVPNPGPAGGTLVALHRIALEGAFGGGAPLAGDQMVFARVRFRIAPLPFDGTYTVYSPYGKFVFADQLASDPRGIFFTEDIGLAVGNFTDALNGRIGPFLVPSATPGSLVEIGPVTALNPIPDTDPTHFGGLPGDLIGPLVTPYPGTGRSYLADPNRVGPVTGSPLPDYVVGDGTTRNPNIFRIEGPNGFVFETFDFALAGRILETPIAGEVTVDRASYARSATETKIDVYATAFPATPPRIPGSPPPTPVPTVLSFFDVPCTATIDPVTLIPGPPFSAPVGAIANAMSNSGSHYYGQSHPATIPLELCIQANASGPGGGTLTFMPASLGDQVFITEALYDPVVQSLSVRATSSDLVVPPTLTVVGFGDIFPATGQLVVPALLAPPEHVTVRSSARGANQFQVSTAVLAGVPNLAPVAVNDNATTNAGTAVNIVVLSNDSDPDGNLPLTVGSLTQPTHGAAVVQANSTVTYTPTAGFVGTDSFTYRAFDSLGAPSNVATVTIGVNPSATTTSITAPAINFPANGLVTVTVSSAGGTPTGNVSLSVDGGAAIIQGLVGGSTTFTLTSPAVGTHNLSANYAAQGSFAASSATGTLLVNPQLENITATAKATRNNTRTAASWDIKGLTNMLTPHTMTVTLTRTGALLGSATTDTRGQWKLQLSASPVVPVPGDTITVTSSLGTSVTFRVAVQ